MLTIFAAPKPFRGHIAVIQRNAIRSWTLLQPPCQIILFGDEEGIAEVAAEFGLRHVPHVARTTFGTPLVSDVFTQAERASDHNLFCFLNSDIVLTSDFMRAIERVVEQKSRFLLVAHRWNLDVSDAFDFKPDWEEELRRKVRTRGELGGPSSIDLFAFTRGVMGEIPPFALGRPRWDNWMLYRARSLRLPLIDATPVVMAVHQNHDYSHHPQGWHGTRHGDEAVANEMLAGGAYFTLIDATHLLTPRGLRRTFDRAHLLRRCETLPVLYPWGPLKWANKVVTLSHPIRSRLRLTVSSVIGRAKN